MGSSSRPSGPRIADGDPLVCFLSSFALTTGSLAEWASLFSWLDFAPPSSTDSSAVAAVSLVSLASISLSSIFGTGPPPSLAGSPVVAVPVVFLVLPTVPELRRARPAPVPLERVVVSLKPVRNGSRKFIGPPYLGDRLFALRRLRSVGRS